MISVWPIFLAVMWVSPGWAAWPEIPSPRNSRIENIGENVRLNGIPMRMQRVLSTGKPADIMRFYRESLGPRHAVEKLSDGVLLSQGQGDYFVTIRIKILGPSLTETLTSVSDARGAQDNAQRTLGFPIPVETQVLSDMESTDAGKISRQLVLVNNHSVDTNVDFITRALTARGFKPEPRETRNLEGGRVLMFGGTSREARLVVVRKAEASNIVLTTVLMP